MPRIEVNGKTIFIKADNQQFKEGTAIHESQGYLSSVRERSESSLPQL